MNYFCFVAGVNHTVLTVIMENALHQTNAYVTAATRGIRRKKIALQFVNVEMENVLRQQVNAHATKATNLTPTVEIASPFANSHVQMESVPNQMFANAMKDTKFWMRTNQTNVIVGCIVWKATESVNA